MKTKIKYGIVGSGLMGCEHISNINLIDSAEVVAISDSNENSINKAKNLISMILKSIQIIMKFLKIMKWMLLLFRLPILPIMILLKKR